MEPAPELTDGEVRLRRWRTGDAPALLDAVTGSLDHLAPFLPWAVGGYTDADAAEFLEKSVHEWETGEAFGYAIVGAEGEILGALALLSRVGPGGLEIGYWIRASHTGRGLVTRAAALGIAEAFRVGAKFVEIRHDEANVRSGLVPQRLGFTRVGVRPAELPGGTKSVGRDVFWRLDEPSRPN